MSLDEVHAWMRARLAAQVPEAPQPLIALAFIDEPVRVDFFPRDTGVEEAIAALRHLLALPRSVRDAIEPQLYAFYCQQIADGAGNFDTPQAQLDWEADFTREFTDPRHATSAAEVWPLVRFVRVRFQRSNGRLIASLWAAAAWDGEHGCALHFAEDGRFLGVTDLNDGPR